MNENSLLAEIKNIIQLNTTNNIKQYIHQRCYQVTKNIYGNPKSLNNDVLNSYSDNFEFIYWSVHCWEK